jgi:hypothetical protein
METCESMPLSEVEIIQAEDLPPSQPNPKTVLFHQIRELCFQKIDAEWITTTKTSKGDTQKSEREVIQKIKEILLELGLTFEEAGSQQSKDFRNVGGIGLDIEIKKTDNSIIYFNDTCPSSEIYYIILFTGKILKKPSAKHPNIPPQVLYLNGAEFLTGCDWLPDFIAELTALKDKYGRGENKKQLAGIMSVYPRPTFKADISSFLSM